MSAYHRQDCVREERQAAEATQHGHTDGRRPLANPLANAIARQSNPNASGTSTYWLSWVSLFSTAPNTICTTSSRNPTIAKVPMIRHARSMRRGVGGVRDRATGAGAD